MRSPNNSIGERFETKEAHEREEIVERVLKRRSTEGCSTRGREIARRSCLNRRVLFDDTKILSATESTDTVADGLTAPRRERHETTALPVTD